MYDDTAQNLVIRDVPQGSTLPKRKGGLGKGKAPMGSDLGGQAESNVMRESVPLKQGHVYVMSRPHRYVPQGFDPNEIVDYRRGTHQISTIRQENPWELEKHEETRNDVRFWNLFQMNWYETAIFAKKGAIIQAKWVDWEHMRRKRSPIFDEVIAACEEKELFELMELRQDWNKEIVAQFYSTLWVEITDERSILH